jgi:hypothetical protein
MFSHQLAVLRLASAVLLTTGGGFALSSHVALAATPLPPCTTSVVSITADSQLPCIPQPGQVLIIVANGTGLTPPATSADGSSGGGTASSDGMTTLADARVDTDDKRQAIRDQYRGQIDETTFNDELADGDGLDKALQDAMTAFKMRWSHLGHG